MKLRKASITCTFPGKTSDIRAYTNSKNKTKLYMCILRTEHVLLRPRGMSCTGCVGYVRLRSFSISYATIPM